MRSILTDRPRLAGEIASTVRLALPLVLGQLSAIGMNVVDTLLAGHLDAHTLGAVAVGTNLWALTIVIAIGVMLALPPSVAQLAGAGRRDAIGPLFRQALWLAAGLGLVLMLLVRYGGPILIDAIGTDEKLRADAAGFVRAVSWGAPALTAYFALRGTSEGLSLPRPTMYMGLLGLLLLLPIGWCLMYGRLGVPALGAVGSGMATAIVLWLQLAAFLAWVGLRPQYRQFHLFSSFERPDFAAIGALLRIGVPMGVSLFMEGSLFVAVALAIGTLGEDVIASHQIAINVSSITFMVPLGIAMATTVRVGLAVGRDDPAGVRYAGYVGYALALGTQGLSSLLMLLFPHTIAALYSNDAAVANLAAQLLVLAGIFQFSDGVQVLSNGALRGLKDTRVPMLVTIVAYWGVGMTSGYFLAFHAGLGVRGMWMGLIAGLSAAAALLFLRFQRLAASGRWKRPLPAASA